jgi:hypothetical protein
MNMEHLTPVVVPRMEWFGGPENRLENRQPAEQTVSCCVFRRQQLAHRERYDLLAKNNCELMSTWPKLALAVAERECVASLKGKRAASFKARQAQRKKIEAQHAHALTDMSA